MDKQGIIISDKEELAEFNNKVNRELLFAFELYYDNDAQHNRGQWPFLKIEVEHCFIHRFCQC